MKKIAEKHVKPSKSEPVVESTPPPFEMKLSIKELLAKKSKDLVAEGCQSPDLKLNAAGESPRLGKKKSRKD